MSKAAAAVAAAPVEGAAPKKGGKKILLFGLIGVVVLALAGVGGFIYMKRSSAHGDKAAHAPKVEKKPPVFAALDPFTVNLADREREHYLQVGLTYEVLGSDVAEEVKAQMPLIRSRILLLLTAKTAAELATAEGKNKLAGELVALARQPLEDSKAANAQNPEHGVTNVHFSAFIIQ